MLFKMKDFEALAEKENGTPIFSKVQEYGVSDFTMLTFESAPNNNCASLMYMVWKLAGAPMLQLIDRIPYEEIPQIAEWEPELFEYCSITFMMLGSRNLIMDLQAVMAFTGVVLKARTRMLTSIEGQEVTS